MGKFIDVNNLFEEKQYPIYAHTADEGKQSESLDEHVGRCIKYFNKIDENKNLRKVVARYAKEKINDISVETISFIYELFCHIVLFHDVGKRTPEYQRKKMNNSKAPKNILISERAEHSLISSLIYLDYYYGKIEKMFPKKIKKQLNKGLKEIALINAYVIARHHSQLESLEKYIEKVAKGEYKCTLKILKEKGLDGYRVSNFKNDRVHLGFMDFDIYDYLYCRFAYSVLVAADYYATTEYINDIEKQDFGNLNEITSIINDYQNSALIKSIRNFESECYEGFNIGDVTDINQLRSSLFIDAERRYRESIDNYVYFLKAPTGSGKTNMALNLSFQMMREKKKLFYIYPFNTLVEQTWETMRKMLSEESINHFAVVNSLTPMKTNESTENSKEYYQKALLDRQFLNYPCVLSTHVSFFNLLFGNDRESPFGFYQLCDSVIVLDEIQSYRNSIWTEIMLFLQAYAKLMDMKIIIMSGTLPDLTLLTENTDKVIQLIDKPQKYFEHDFFKKRVKLSFELLEDENFDLEKLKNHIITTSLNGSLVLVEFIFKSTAEKFYQMLVESEDIDIPIYCITGDDSLFEREKILRPIREKTIQKAILVATQVIEAGVDIDMDIGYKDISKLDSEEQFLGRINRSCKKEGITYFFNYNKAEKVYRDDYRMDKTVTLENKKMEELLQTKDFDSYYDKVIDMLKTYRNDSTNENGLKEFLDVRVATLDFSKIAEHMELISKDMMTRSIFLNRKLEVQEGTVLDGQKVWDDYKSLLMNDTVDYAEKRVKLSEIRVDMNHFIYEVTTDIDVLPNDMIGELWFIENGEDYLKNGKLDKEKLFKNKAPSFI